MYPGPESVRLHLLLIVESQWSEKQLGRTDPPARYGFRKKHTNGYNGTYAIIHVYAFRIRPPDGSK